MNGTLIDERKLSEGHYTFTDFPLANGKNTYELLKTPLYFMEKTIEFSQNTLLQTDFSWYIKTTFVTKKVEIYLLFQVQKET